MKKYLLILVLSCSVFAQEKLNQLDENGNRHGLWKGTHKESNRPRYEGVFEHGIETGVFKYFDDTKAGSLIATRDFSKKEGSCYAIFYDQKKNIVSEGQLRNKIHEGVWKYYHFESKMVMTIENYKDGKLDGIRKVFYKDGTIAEEVAYKNNSKEGSSKIYSEKGKLIEELNYKNNQLNGFAAYYDGNGSKLYEGTYKNGSKTGNWKFFEANKVIKEVPAAKFSKELIKYEQRYTEKVSKTMEQAKKEITKEK